MNGTTITTTRPALEALDDRVCPATFWRTGAGQLIIMGTVGPDSIQVSYNRFGGVVVSDGLWAQTFAANSIRGIQFYGWAGNDWFYNSTNVTCRGWGGLGNDFLCGGGGQDYFWGGLGNDWCYGNGGYDCLWGDAGLDYCYGGGGYDSIWGGWGNDYCYGGGGIDSIYGGYGDDWLYYDSYDYYYGGLGFNTTILWTF